MSYIKTIKINKKPGPAKIVIVKCINKKITKKSFFFLQCTLENLGSLKFTTGIYVYVIKILETKKKKTTSLKNTAY